MDDIIYFDEAVLQQAMITAPVEYFIHYDSKTGNILSVSNERNTNHEFALKVDYETAAPFLEGKQKFANYIISYFESVLTVVARDEELFLRNNILEQILDKTNLDSKDFIAEWNTDYWKFYIKDNIKKSILEQGITNKVVIFISLEVDLNRLVRTIELDTAMLANSDSITIPFISTVESNIDKLVVSTKLIFQSYGLKINYE